MLVTMEIAEQRIDPSTKAEKPPFRPALSGG
jgi:hypothetical protein